MEECLFCNIIEGKIDSKKVYEDDKIMGILDINPWVENHFLLMPKEHVPIMPVMPQELFKHLFGQIPGIVKDYKKNGFEEANVFIANGACAGQNSPHFLMHILPRKKDDGFELIEYEGEYKEEEGIVSMLKNNLPIMMNNHFKRSPADWHKDEGLTPDFLENVKEMDIVVYEDEKALCVIPKNGYGKGHMIIYSKEYKNVEDSSFESCNHLFYVSSYAATAVYEGMKAEGSNIILKSGSIDNPEGLLAVHVFPRWQGDELVLMDKKEVKEVKTDPLQEIRNAINRIKNN